jgi:hypothetical protein
MPQLSTGFPSGPFVDPQSGEITDVWRRYLLTLDARTGGRLGADAGDIATRVTAETSARSAGDVNLSGAIAGETALRITAIANEAALRAARDNDLSVQIARAIGTSGSAEPAARAAADTALGLRIDALGATGVYAPLVTGDVPPVLIGTTDGQAIMVRIH